MLAICDTALATRVVKMGEKGHFGSFWVIFEHFCAWNCARNCGGGFPFQIIASLFLSDVQP
jgi:hypothetical protein